MSEQDTGRRTAGAFDIRNFIGALLGLYGAILVAVHVFGSEEQLVKSEGLRINLWTGLALLATAATFFVWARLRPTIVPTGDRPEDMQTGS